MTAGIKYSITEEQLNGLIQRYSDKGGAVYVFDDGSLRTGTVIFHNNGKPLANFVSYEEFINEWSSDQILIKYKRQLPKKWLKRMQECEHAPVGY